MRVSSVNIGKLQENPWQDYEHTGIDKSPVQGPVALHSPSELGESGVAGDELGDKKHHGGHVQAVYSYAAEDYRLFERITGRTFAPGAFGENLTTEGLDVNALVLGQLVRVGPDVVLEASAPRIPCNTFRGYMDTAGWLKTFTAQMKPGAYFRVIEEGEVRAGDAIEPLEAPAHGYTIAKYFEGRMRDKKILHDMNAAPGLPEYVAAYLERKLAS
ncbi:MOSC domain-containing protein [Salininema proteolyticum]|uniref:MOSC domain-containing protein n=1 Tax=Salininema proteolyticum TaxID=1607685 RepID=A0ABV8TZW1_9ACTN